MFHTEISNSLYVPMHISMSMQMCCVCVCVCVRACACVSVILCMHACFEPTCSRSEDTGVT